MKKARISAGLSAYRQIQLTIKTVAVCNGHDLDGVVIVLTGSVHFQFYAKIAITVPTEQRLRLVVIVLNRLAGSTVDVAVVSVLLQQA